ncbi:putative serine protease HtrA [bacterium BMS3Abin15]|nr:putative serine protease HtrA [bacterium BMS3Abin15]HDZ85183.1 trypsin-like serine protease [Candidatus Moranbacteria bacterium]
MEDKINKPKKIPIVGIIILTVFLSATTGTFFGFMAGGIGKAVFSKVAEKLNLADKKDNENVEIQREIVIQEDSAIIDVVEKSSSAAVSIVITKDVPRFRSFFDGPFSFEFFSNPFRSQGEPETETRKVGGGSGFFISEDGMIVTNKHVVEDTDANYTVVTSDGKEFSASILAQHPLLDIALLDIKGDNFSALKLGDSDNLKVGQTVIAIGNPLGEFSNSVSRGIISGLQRDITAGTGTGRTERLTNIIQTDAAINPGNSGGPLLDINGNAVGVNVAMAQGVENIGFALPINQIKKFVNQIQTEGKVSIPFIGVRYIILNKSIQKENNLPFDYGALVLRGETMTDFAVVPGSPADKAGIVENDIILEIGGKKVTDDNPLGNIINEYNVGDEVVLRIWSKGEIREVMLTLEERQ